jgi:hypothetical protein
VKRLGATVLHRVGTGDDIVAHGVTDEYSWRLGRVSDPFGHEWEIGRPLGGTFTGRRQVWMGETTS